MRLFLESSQVAVDNRLSTDAMKLQGYALVNLKPFFIDATTGTKAAVTS